VLEIPVAVRDEALRLDADDELARFRDEFYLPQGQIYLDGNSLGLLSRRAEAAVLRVMREWKEFGVEGWTGGDPPWFYLAEALAANVAPLLGAEADEVIVANSTTVNLHQLLATLYEPRSPRTTILTDELIFPSDRYALQSQLALRGMDPDLNLKIVKSADGVTLDENEIVAAMTDDVQMVVLPTVIYTSGQLLDVAKLTCEAHRRGILVGFDCSHSIGAIPHQFDSCGVDFAFWCHYKYLNGGPGAPGGLYLHRRHFGRRPGLAGWFGCHKARQFDMSSILIPENNAGALQIGTPHILSMAPLQAALELQSEAGIDGLRMKSLRLTHFLREIVVNLLSEHDIVVVTPQEDNRRGGHIALRHSDAARLCRSLRALGVVPDYRPPDLMRLAPVPLYTRFIDCCDAIGRLKQVLVGKLYNSFDAERQLVP
jgi:kynureninase